MQTIKNLKTQAFTLIEGVIIMAILAAVAVTVISWVKRTNDKSARAVCLENEKHLGLAFLQYAQDNDEKLPLVSMPTSPITWTVAVRPYYKDRKWLRCPADKSDTWTIPYDNQEDLKADATLGGQGRYRESSYAYNLWLSGARKYGKLPNIKSPQKVILLTESAEDLTRDHIHPPCWSLDDQEAKKIPGHDGMMYTSVWDPLKSEPEEIAITRHNGGFISVYLDGHASWAQWSQLWYAKPGIYDGAFDPRQ